MNSIKELTQELLPLTSQIANHPLYHEISSVHNLRLFMEQHVFAVWDFMCLLKELHRRIVSTSAPWFPPKDALSANLINSILVEEEGDITEDGIHYASHFDIYLAAMEKINANTDTIKKLLTLLMEDKPITEAVELVQLRPATKEFILTTFSFFELDAHQIATAFVFGREGITSSMFSPLVTQIAELEKGKQYNLNTLIYYFNRHIELDSNEHLPKALRMLDNLIGKDKLKFQQVAETATKALIARINFLTDIQKLCQMRDI